MRKRLPKCRSMARVPSSTSTRRRHWKRHGEGEGAQGGLAEGVIHYCVSPRKQKTWITLSANPPYGTFHSSDFNPSFTIWKRPRLRVPSTCLGGRGFPWLRTSSRAV